MYFMSSDPKVDTLKELSDQLLSEASDLSSHIHHIWEAAISLHRNYDDIESIKELQENYIPQLKSITDKIDETSKVYIRNLEE